MSAYTFPGLQQSNHANSNFYSKMLVKQIEETSFTGIFCLYTPIVFTYFSVASMAFYDAFAVYLNVMITFGLVFRVIAFNWVGNISRREGLQEKKWQIFSLITPALALILIGQSKKANRRSATIASSTQSGRVYQAEQNYFGRKEKLYRKVS